MIGVRTFLLQFTVAAASVCLLSGAAAPPGQKLMSLSYNPSGVTSMAQREKGVPEATLRADLQHLALYTQRVRTYSTEFGLDRVPAIARELGLKVTFGIWLGRDRVLNAANVEKGLKVIAAYPDVIDRVYVGNEAIVRGELTAAEVIVYIEQVKSALAGRNLQIATAEPWHVWLKNPALGNAADFIGAHIFGYHDGPPVNQAADYLDQRVRELQTAFPQKKVVVAETGWPSRGPVNQASAPSPAAQADYLKAFLRRAAEAHYDYNLVEAYDQLWKAPEEKGALWGLFTDGGKPKFDLQVP